jgi:hypothetical protein
MSADDSAEVSFERPFQVRETRLLFRLTPRAEHDFSHASRQEAIVAADSEEEARCIAHLHDPHGNDRGSEVFACALIECIGTQVHGDISFISTPIPRRAEPRNEAGAVRTWMLGE